ncbi:DSBA oxidoreductase [Iodidimonas gelatinilytica]|uniref:DSBA oxidoreductase n=1 Tax=Iodidimonas gelatinilytica TaxID=1236966 RepID=A0A5A7N0J8_9PROT|nr:DsbA family oxidoreductase [Iodidimonas gelatinilytica]GER00576.1 DSBA oxidoreductase [Iodidimonas gelatinilytica]
MADSIKIDIISDTVCPWCLIGKRRLEQALAQRPDLVANIHWRPYQLHPELPLGGADKAELLASKFGSAERAREIFDHIAAEGAKEGIAFAFDRITRAPNTLDSHRLIHWSASAGGQNDVVEALFRAYFMDGEDISNRDLLTSIAEKCGMEGGVVRDLLDTDRDRQVVMSQIDSVRKMGITGVPTFIFDGRLAVNGAHPASALLEVIDKAKQAA